MKLSDINVKLLGRQASILDHEHYKKSAVLLPLVQKNGETHVLFEVRSMTLRSQPGDICFPGGRKDEDDRTPLHCAIRETTEELGVSKASIENVHPLDYIVSDTGRIIYPFVGTITTPEKIQPNEAEVGEVFTVPLSYLLNNPPETYKVKLQVIPEEDFPFDRIVGGENYNWQVRHINELFYQYDGKVIWGLTAKILRHFLDLMKE
ncbi:NUDIX hydrolase [Ornithinibacillus halophilus]|uniref:NUDIX domain-containing protein n=1 Tax=Ornithinibacillus halophilus TaxID=930117 RepID=A0A1M5GCG2_9BACI|nr:CoA pyrophosphatase [Ornithinibacillus halophilus]SHG01480.1 NUDIX domain-containing protein [Ornithinibacillus halophilus]